MKVSNLIHSAKAAGRAVRDNKAVKAVIRNRYSIGAFAGIGTGLYGGLWSAAAGDTYGIIAFIVFFAAMFAMALGVGSLDKATDRDEPVVRWMDEMMKDAQ